MNVFDATGHVIVVPQKRVIFVHVPKNAGRSIISALTLCDSYKLGNEHVIGPRDHVTAQQGKELLSDWDDYFSFAFVREPESYARSFYNTVRWQGSFDDFLLNGNLPDQRSFICDPHGNQIMSYVGRYERLTEEYQMIAERYDLPTTLPWVGKSEPWNHREGKYRPGIFPSGN